MLSWTNRSANARLAHSNTEMLGLLDKHAGVGLWDAVLHNGDPMHARSTWRWSSEFRRLLGFGSAGEFPDVVGSWADRLHPPIWPPPSHVRRLPVRSFGPPRTM